MTQFQLNISIDKKNITVSGISTNSKKIKKVFPKNYTPYEIGLITDEKVKINLSKSVRFSTRALSTL